MSQIEKLRQRRLVLIEYLKVKVDECDWHAVSDAANDIRVIEAQISACQVRQKGV